MLPSYLTEKKTLAYKVIIHVKSVADFNPRSPSPRGPPSSDDDISDREDYHFSRGNGPRIHAFACDRGVPDGDADLGLGAHRRDGGAGRARRRAGAATASFQEAGTARERSRTRRCIGAAPVAGRPPRRANHEGQREHPSMQTSGGRKLGRWVWRPVCHAALAPPSVVLAPAAPLGTSEEDAGPAVLAVAPAAEVQEAPRPAFCWDTAWAQALERPADYARCAGQASRGDMPVQASPAKTSEIELQGTAKSASSTDAPAACAPTVQFSHVDKPAAAAAADRHPGAPSVPAASAMRARPPSVCCAQAAGPEAKLLAAEDPALASPEPPEAAATLTAAQEEQEGTASHDAEAEPDVECCAIQDRTPTRSSSLAERRGDSSEEFATPATEAAGAGFNCATAEHRSSSISGRIKKFAKKVLQKTTAPLLPTKVFDSSAKLPIRSRRIAAQPLSRIPVAKRGEFLVRQRLGLVQDGASAGAGHSLVSLLSGNDEDWDSRMEAMQELFADGNLQPRAARRRAQRA